MRTIVRIAVCGVLSITAPNAHAMRFANNFVQFELPANWKCGLEGAEWVCQSHDEKLKRDAIIVLAAKLKGDQDTNEKYFEYLKKPRSFNSTNGKTLLSNPKFTREKTIATQPWVDSLHLDSEIPNYYTRYLATTKNDIGVLVTYSVYKEKYAEYDKQFEDMISTLKVFRNGPLNQKPNSLADRDGEKFRPIDIGPPLVQPAPPQTVPTVKVNNSAPPEAGWLALLLIGGGAAFYLWKRQS